MEKLLSAAITYLIVLKLEVRSLFPAEGITVLITWPAMGRVTHPGATCKHGDSRSNGMEARNLPRRDEKLDIWVRISA
jgi:hypothetical protein